LRIRRNVLPNYGSKRDLGGVHLTQFTTATDAEVNFQTTTRSEIIRGVAGPGVNDYN
jgi:hypothetical protein